MSTVVLSVIGLSFALQRKFIFANFLEQNKIDRNFIYKHFAMKNVWGNCKFYCAKN